MSDAPKARIGIGIITYNRPKYFKKCLKSVLKHLAFVDQIVVYNDGSDVAYDYDWVPLRVVIKHVPVNKGVAVAKNWCLRDLMKHDCDYLFIIEDDMEILDRKAIVWYLAAHRMTGVDHMMFAHHGPANEQPDSLLAISGPIEVYKSCIGSYCFYTRDILEKVGLMDENFINAWEHVEHSWRINKSHDVPYGMWPDVVDSREVIREQKGSIDNSSIGAQDNLARVEVIIAGLEYWKQKEGKTWPAQHTLDYYLNWQQELEEI